MAATGSLFDDILQPGYRIGPYSLLECFQQGGQSDIWSAWDDNARRVVAVKVMPIVPDESTGDYKALEDESGVIARLNHPNILPLYAHGKVERSSYIVMPYLPFGAVSRLMQSGPVRPSILIPMAAQMASVLDYLHTHRIVHRDLKPSNFLIDSTMRIYLTDFGLAKPLSEDTLPLHTGHGTAPYSSPEQHTKRLVSYTTDIYSLGIVLFELLTGRLPWGGEVALAMRQLDSSEELPDPHEVNPSLPAALAPALRRLTAQDPRDRPASATEAFSLVANALLSDSDQGTSHPLTLEEALDEIPAHLTDDERMAHDAQRLMDYSLRLWEADSDPFMLSFTNFCLLDSVYADTERFGLVPDEARQRFMLHSALAYGRDEHIWWSQIADVAARVEVCEWAIANQSGAARTRAVFRLLGEPLVASGEIKVSPLTQERLVELAVEMQDSALFEGILVLIGRSSERGGRWHMGHLSAVADQALAGLALSDDPRARHAAHLIGQTRNQDALGLLLERRSGAQQAQVVASLMEVRQAAGDLPGTVPVGLRLQVVAKTVAQQLFADRPRVFRAYLASALAAALSLGFYVYNLYLLPQFLDAARILNAVGSGLLFGIIIGLGIFAARLIAHRLHTLAPLPRLGVATGLGGAIMYFGFIGYHALFLDSSPTGVLIGAAALLIALGFGGGALLAIRSLLRAVLSSTIIAIAITLSWHLHLTTSATPLLYFEASHPMHMTFLILMVAVCMGFIPHVVSLSLADENARRS
jgi:serine/threonine protein kinase